LFTARAKVRLYPSPFPGLHRNRSRGLPVRVDTFRVTLVFVSRDFAVRRAIWLTSGPVPVAIAVHRVLERLQRQTQTRAVRDFQVVPEIARRVVVNLVKHVRPARTRVIVNQRLEPQVGHGREVRLRAERPTIVVARL
tara:strand:- start:2143 stop:2556 length:414 start_codon:yes stop_codon:yes gene_type:complete